MRFIFCLLFTLFVSCNEKDGTVLVSRLQEMYACEEYTIDSPSYMHNIEHVMKLRVVNMSNSYINLPILEETINRKFSTTKISFDIRTYSEIPTPFVVYPRDLFEEHFKFGFITMVVIPDGSIIDGGNRQGAADGIPSLENVSLGRPVFFVKELALKSVNMGIVAHEIGHVLGLAHTFQDYDMYNKGLNCETGDKVPDTVTMPSNSLVDTKSCTHYLPDELKDIYTEKEKQEAGVNYMSYSPPTCLSSFTEGQIQFMRKMIEVNPLLNQSILKTDRINLK